MVGLVSGKNDDDDEADLADLESDEILSLEDDEIDIVEFETVDFNKIEEVQIENGELVGLPSQKRCASHTLSLVTTTDVKKYAKYPPNHEKIKK